MYWDFNFYRRDLRKYEAIIYYLLIHTTKNNKELDWEHLNWLLNTANYEYFKKYFYWILPIQYLHILDNKTLIASDFENDWTASYKMTRTGLIRKTPYNILDRDDTLTYESYLSPALKECLDHTILKYKIYGKKLLELMNFMYPIKSKLCKRK